MRSEVINRKQVTEIPDFFIDLNLDQVIDAVVSGKEEYNLKPFFYTPLPDIDSIQYRQQIMSDLEDPALFRHLLSFAKSMQDVRKQLSDVNRLYYQYHKEHLFLDVVNMYCEAAMSLENHLSFDKVRSQGLLSFRKYLKDYVKSDAFSLLLAETKEINNRLSLIKYCIHIKGLNVQVKKYQSEPEYNIEVEKVFSRFKQKEVKNYKVGFAHPMDMNHVEAKILDGVALLFPDIFIQLSNFYKRNQNFQDKLIVKFDREIQFYISYLEYMAKFKQAG
jgi:hypothetical protein